MEITAMSDTKFFKAALNRTLIIATAMVLALLMVILTATQELMILIVIVLVALFALLFDVRGYVLTDRNLRIQGRLWQLEYALKDFEGASFRPACLEGSIWQFRHGRWGLSSILGSFAGPFTGRITTYVTDSRKSVVIDFSNARLVISPDDPEGFIAALEDQVLRSREKR
jgi:hypothetical protein